MTAILKLEHLRKDFGGVVAVDDFSFEINEGQVTAIIGPNGAGKTTIYNLISKVNEPDKGTLYFDGVDVTDKTQIEIARMGISRTFQNIRLFKEMTVLDNVMIGQHVHTPVPIISILLNGKKSIQYEKVAKDRALEALKFMGLDGRAGETVKNLAYGQQRLVEFARALACDPKIILLDEPAAGMNPTEKANLLSIIDRLRGEGYTLIIIEHDMKLVMNICDRISVLDHGKVISQGKPEEVRRNPDVITAYLGKGGDSNVGD